MHCLQHRRSAAAGINRPIDPRVAMVPSNYQSLGPGITARCADYVPDGAKLIILFQMQLHPDRAGAKVISKRQPAFPFARRFRSAKMLKNWPGIGGGDRRGGHLRRCGWISAPD